MTNQLLSAFRTAALDDIRSNIERIIASYRHTWDIYTELLQNAADAIYQKHGDNNLPAGRITLDVQPDNRTIEITDNGIGIGHGDLADILVTGRSIKRETHQGRYGFMGYGLTYIAFQSSTLYVSSVKDGQRSTRTWHDLFRFVYDDQDLPSSLEERNGDAPQPTSDESGTIVRITFPAPFPDPVIEQSIHSGFMYANNPQLFHTLLRTRTAVGSLDPVFTASSNFQFTVTVAGYDLDVPPYFLTTREVIEHLMPGAPSTYEVDGSDYTGLLKYTEHLAEADKRRARKAVLLDKKVTGESVGSGPSLETRFYLAATSKDNVNDYNESIGCTDDSEFCVQNGVWLALDGMPTGICLESYEHGSMLPFTVVADVIDPSIRNDLDAGRKGITAYRAEQIREKARQLLRDYRFIEYRQYVTGTTTRLSNPLYNPRKSLQNKINRKHVVDVGLSFNSFPPDEEQEVVALFVALVARNTLRGYTLKGLSGHEVYDCICSYFISRHDAILHSDSNPLGIYGKVFDTYGDGNSVRKEDLIIEFKRDIYGLYKDIQQSKKSPDQIDILVCWSLPDNFADHLRKYGDHLRTRILVDNVFFGVTHTLSIQGRHTPLPIISLRSLIATLNGRPESDFES